MKMIVSPTRILCAGMAIGSFCATPALADPPGNWNGPYAGGSIGGIWSDFDHSGSDASFTGGGDIGDNWQYGHMVVGAEGDFSLFENHTGTNGVKFSEDWYSTMRGRLGFSLDRFLPYVTAGLGLTDTELKVAGAGRTSNLEPGLAIGGGVDMKITDRWIGRLEYLHVGVPNDSTTVGGTTVSGGSGNHIFRVGLNYRF